jgi:predicted CxxxxCH...CXXCH cytochrome family protein
MSEREVRTVMEELSTRDRSCREDAAEKTLQRPASFLGISFMAVIAVFFCLILVFPHSAGAASMGPNSPTSAANNAAVGTVAWTNAGNVFTSNNGYATVALGVNQVSNYLVASGLNFAIPVGATIDGIAVSIERKEGLAYYVSIKDSSVKLVKNGTITGAEHAGSALWSSTEAIVNYGSGTDLWGTTWTSADINAATFGVAIAVQGIGSSSQTGKETASIDQVTVTVYYTPLGGCIPNAATVVLNPSSQTISTDGGSKAYTLTIINNDTGACPDETFSLTKNDSGDTAKMSSAILPSSVVVSAGGSTSVPLLTVTAVSGQTTGSLTSYVTATGISHAALNTNNVVTTLGIVSCVRIAPTVALAPASQTISTEGGSTVYTLTVTNNDSAICGSETFNLSKSDSNSTNFNVSTLSAASVTLATGASSSGLTLTVNAKTGQASGTNVSSVTAASANHANKTSNNVMTTLAACLTSVPTLSLSPAAQTITSDGAFVDYTLSITNNDSVNCPNMTFNFNAINSNSTDFLSSTVTPNSLTMAQGATANVNLRVTAKAGATSGTNNSRVNSARQGQAHSDSSNTVTTTISLAACVRNIPTVTLAPASQTITTNGGNALYTLLVRNNDTAPCASETFNLSKTDNNTTNFNASVISSPSVILAPGASSSGLTLTTNAKTGQSSGTNVSSVTAASTNHANRTSNDVTTTLSVSACTKNTPILVINPSAQAITPGGTVEYKVKVRNTDSSVCSSSTFAVSVVSDSNSSAYNTPSVLSAPSLALAPGQTGTLDLTVGSKTTASNGNFNDTVVRVSEAGHTSPTNVTVRTTVAPISPLMHNSINTQSTKWGANGWGIPGGRYGEFECKTCHTPGETANIKRVKESITSPNGTDTFPGGVVNFQKTTTPNGFGDDSNAHATSTKVCEVCHTYDATRTNGVKFHAYNMSAGGADLSHNNNVDCMVCHKHQSAFKASCTSCHGSPPTVNTLGGPNGLANDPFVTGSVTAGAHNTHVTKYNDCNFCHNNAVMPKESAVFAGKGDISIGFSYFGITTGSYTGQSGVSYNDVAGSGTLTCSAVYCHGTTMAPNGGTNTTPKWNDPTTATCGTCHGATAAAPPSRGLHVKHTGSYGSYFGKAYSCTLCHNLASNQHVNNKSEIIFSSDVRVSGAAYSGTDTMLDAYGNCSNVYCHSNVQTSPPGGAVTYKTVNWGSSQTYSCNVCHEGPAAHTTFPADFASGNTTGSHSKHATYTIYCGTCHANDVTKDPADIATNGRCDVCHTMDRHADHAINVNIVNIYGGTYSGSPAPGDSYGGCSSVYCHSSGQNSTGGALAGGDYKTPTWGTTLDCAGCHKDMDTDAAATGSHVKHAQTAGIACATCHNGYTETTVATVTHVNKSINLSFSGQGTGTTYSQGNVHAQGNGYGTCSTSSCHSSGQGADGSGTGLTYGNPTWGGTLNCGSCHKNMDTDAAATGSHVKHAQTLNYSCATCHNGYTETTVAAATHNNGSINLIFSGTATGTTYSQGNTHLLGNGYGSCGTSYCHSNGSGTYKAPTWGGASTGCNFCHDALPTSASHAKHVKTAATAYGVASVSTTGGVYDFGCGNCHPKDAAKHADGNIDILLKDGVAGDTLKVLNSPSANRTGSGSTTVCNLTYCHSNGTNTGAAIVAGSSPQWGNSPYSGDSCAMCHGNSPSSGSHQNHVMAGIHFDTIFTGTTGLAAMGNTATGAHGNAATANTISCNVCHNGTVTSAANDKNTSCSTASCHDTAPRLKGNAAIAAGSNLHLNGAKNIVLQAGAVRSKAQVRDDDDGNAPAGLTRNVGYKASGAYDSATINAGDWASGSKTCTTACHLSQQSPTWGTATTCLSCHTTLPR